MPGARWWKWWQTERRALAFGLAAGVLWGGLLAGTVTPRDWLIYDQGTGLVHGYSGQGILLRSLRAELFFREHQSVLLQATLLLLALAGLAGWATWQLTRVQPRGQPQPPLGAGTDWYLIALAVGGLLTVALFQRAGAGAWFKGDPPTPLAAGVALVEVVLPLYMGGALFLVWFRRLPSVKPPDWETRYARPARRSASASWRGWRAWRRDKGGEPPAA
jgi:hypothetical protein